MARDRWMIIIKLWKLEPLQRRITAKHRILVANKMDLPDAQEELEQKFKRQSPKDIIAISQLKINKVW